MRVFLTGGTGLVGSHVARRLRADGVEVVCLQRPTSDTGFLKSIGCRIVTGDVRDEPDRAAERMAGCDGLVHAAALVYSGASWPKARAVNVKGTEHVLRSAARAGIVRAVHISSVAVYGDVSAPVDENTPTDAPLRRDEIYARSKRAAEAVAFRVHRQEGVAVSVLRPSVVYGERDRLFTPILARLLRLPLTPLLGAGDSTLPVVYAGNVASAVVDALSRGAAGGRAFVLGADVPLTQRRLLRGLARALGRTSRLVSLPEGLVRWGARLGDTLGLSVPGARQLALRRIVRLATTDNPYSSRRAREVLGWEPRYDAAEALERTGAWFRGGGRRDPQEAVAGDRGRTRR